MSCYYVLLTRVIDAIFPYGINSQYLTLFYREYNLRFSTLKFNWILASPLWERIFRVTKPVLLFERSVFIKSFYSYKARVKQIIFTTKNWIYAFKESASKIKFKDFYCCTTSASFSIIYLILLYAYILVHTLFVTCHRTWLLRHSLPFILPFSPLILSLALICTYSGTAVRPSLAPGISLSSSPCLLSCCISKHNPLPKLQPLFLTVKYNTYSLNSLAQRQENAIGLGQQYNNMTYLV